MSKDSNIMRVKIGRGADKLFIRDLEVRKKTVHELEFEDENDVPLSYKYFKIGDKVWVVRMQVRGETWYNLYPTKERPYLGAIWLHGKERVQQTIVGRYKVLDAQNVEGKPGQVEVTLRKVEEKKTNNKNTKIKVGSGKDQVITRYLRVKGDTVYELEFDDVADPPKWYPYLRVGEKVWVIRQEIRNRVRYSLCFTEDKPKLVPSYTWYGNTLFQHLEGRFEVLDAKEVKNYEGQVELTLRKVEG